MRESSGEGAWMGLKPGPSQFEHKETSIWNTSAESYFEMYGTKANLRMLVGLDAMSYLRLTKKKTILGILLFMAWETCLSNS